MSRITRTFDRLKKERKKALIPFITAGDPSLAVTEKLIYTLEKAGADIIELGIPFSDPMADGPVIQASSERALKKKVTLDKILSLVKKVRKKSEIPILLMGYYNPVFSMGHDKFASRARSSGVDAVLVVDLPPEEAKPLKKSLRKNRIDLVFLLAPTSDAKRIKTVISRASGFIYYVSLTGVTGAKLKIDSDLAKMLKKIRQDSSLPVAVGFGISSPHQAGKISKLADGVVVGSSLVKLIAKKVSKKFPYQSIHRYISSLKSAI